ncbi:hypothetical protein [Nigerium massiliense]|uniref:hypothetical protein n=1 Tax=Nigerium massiliense TaxID=1522317 RepID=UPI0012FD6894|nr:hypothetical protein [Nigerium massiliense]
MIRGTDAIREGAGIRTANGTWFGQWINAGRLAYCIGPGLNVATMPWFTETAPAKLTQA